MAACDTGRGSIARNWDGFFVYRKSVKTGQNKPEKFPDLAIAYFRDCLYNPILTAFGKEGLPLPPLLNPLHKIPLHVYVAHVGVQQNESTGCSLQPASHDAIR